MVRFGQIVPTESVTVDRKTSAIEAATSSRSLDLWSALSGRL